MANDVDGDTDDDASVIDEMLHPGITSRFVCSGSFGITCSTSSTPCFGRKRATSGAAGAARRALSGCCSRYLRSGTGEGSPPRQVQRPTPQRQQAPTRDSQPQAAPGESGSRERQGRRGPCSEQDSRSSIVQA
jgi:hypothetical protein